MERKYKIYAAYGSNMNFKQMKDRCPDAKVIGTGILKDFKLTFRGIYKGVANVEEYTGEFVPIVLWNITAKCETNLDRYEGFPKLYTKKTVTVILEEVEAEAMIYLMTDKYKDKPAKPNRRYSETIERGYEDNGIPKEKLFMALQEAYSELY